MTFYLGAASQADEAGHVWLSPAQVAEFALSALLSGPGKVLRGRNGSPE